MVSESPLRARYLKAVEDARIALEEAQASFDVAKAKLAAFDLLAADLEGPGSEPTPRTLKEGEVEELALTMRGTFTYKDIVRVAFRKYGHFVDALSVRTWLNRIAQREETPLEIVKRGEGPKASVFRVKKESEVAH